MNGRLVLLALLGCLGAFPAAGYIRLKGSNGTPLARPDFANVQVGLNSASVPGMGNAQNFLWITPDSDVVGALNAAMGAWNGIPNSSAHFAPLQSTAATSSTAGNNVVIFLDTPAIRSALGPSTVAQTSISYLVGGSGDGSIAWSFTYMNPVFTFSTTGAANTVDLQSVLTHELGHALGSNHTGGIGSTMFQNENPASAAWRYLSPDDIAFASGVYPSASAAAGYGTIAGTLSLAGSPLRNALVNAVDTTAGTVFSGLTSGVDGTYTIAAPPGSYYLMAQPINGNINYNFYLCTPDIFPACGVLDNIDTNFQPGLAGTGTAASVTQVTAGNVTNGDFSPPAGAASISLQYINAVPANGSWPDWTTIYFVGSSLQIASGGTVDLIVAGTGLDTTLSDANISFLGPLTLQPGTVRWDASLSNGLKVMRMTVIVGPVSSPTTATLVIQQNGSTAAYPGGLVLLPGSN